jgi:hypothetical protein
LRFIENGDINLDDIDARAKRRCGLLLRAERKGHEREERDSDTGAHRSHRAH